MALFRAYAENPSLDPEKEVIAEANPSSVVEAGNVSVILISDDSDPDAPEEISGDKTKAKKRKCKNYDKYDYCNVEETEENFYTDRKREKGNFGVSTLYNPARPKYDYLHVVIGNFTRLQNKHKRSKAKRYFNTDYSKADKDDDSSDKKKKHVSKMKKKKENFDYIDINDSGIAWDDSNVESDLLEKTANFNKLLSNNPYDVPMWLQFVKFQEDYVTFNVLNNRVASEATARNLCYSKQLTILDTAIKKNFNSIELLTKKVELSRQTLPNDQYLSMLKSLVSTPELQKNLLTRAWFWYIDGMQCSMALCSVPSVKEMYAAAIKALSKAQGSNYNNSHIDIVFRLGIFLRQAGLMEQFWMFFKMTMEMNFIISKNSKDFSQIEDAFILKEDEITTEENKIITSGLPLHSVWSRIELLRSHFYWLPSRNECDDPQRVVFSTDFSDFIKPIPVKSDVFHIVVNFIKALKVPLLPIRQTIPVFSNNCFIEWEYDCSELFLSFLYSAVASNKFEESQIKALCQIVKDLSDEPSYLNLNGEFFKFVSNIIVHCAQWFGGSEKTALYLWWLQLQRILLIAMKHTDPDKFKSAATSVRKTIKDVLKTEKDNILLFNEFAKIESEVFGLQRGISIMEMSFKNVGHVSDVNRVHLARSLVEKLLEDESNKTENVLKSIHILMATSTEKQLATDTSAKFTKEEVENSIKKFSDKTDELLLNVSNCDKETNLVNYMLPDQTIDWICCHGWMVYLAEPRDNFIKLYKKIITATETEASDKSPESKRRRWLRENMIEWMFLLLKFNKNLLNTCDDSDDFNYKNILNMALNEYSSNSCVVWNSVFLHTRCGPVGRTQILKLLKGTDSPSQLLAIGMLVDHFVLLYQNNDPLFENIWQTSHENRLLNLFNTIMHIPHMTKSALIWKLYLVFLSHHTNQSFNTTKKILYQALDECPWNKDLYRLGCIYIPSEFSEIVDLMVEKQIRLHTMPEELQPL